MVRELATGHFLADADNVLFLGPPGAGKTHLAVALGLRPCSLGFGTAFVTAAVTETPRSLPILPREGNGHTGYNLCYQRQF